MVEVNQPMGLDKMRVNTTMALNMDSWEVGFAQKMCSQRVFNFFQIALLLLV
jgi:hypothetical protein